MPGIFWVVPVAGVLTLIFAIVLARNVLSRSKGTLADTSHRQGSEDEG